MKKIIAIIVAAVFALGLAAASSGAIQAKDITWGKSTQAKDITWGKKAQAKDITWGRSYKDTSWG